MLFPYIREAGLTWMAPIIFLSFCAVAFCLERLCYWALFWIRSFGRSGALEKVLTPPFQRKRARDICRRSHDKVLLVLGQFLKMYEDLSLPIAERKARMVAEAEVEDSRRFLDLLSLIANISGTLGLMGTVVGISLSFKSLVNSDSRALALSLSTAMYTTIGGIILFLISYLFLFFFSKFSDHFESDLDVNIHKLKDLLEIEEKSAMVFDAPQASVPVDKKPSRETNGKPVSRRETSKTKTAAGAAKHERRA